MAETSISSKIDNPIRKCEPNYGRAINILQIIPTFLKVGGIEFSSRNLALSLLKKGIRTTILSPTNRSSFSECNERITTVHIHSLLICNKTVIPLDLSSMLHLIKNHDVIHIYGLFSLMSVLAFLFSFLCKKRVLITVLMYGELMNHPNVAIRAIAPLITNIGKLFVKLADAIHVKNIQDYNRLRKINPTTLLIPNGLSNRYFEQKIDQISIRKELGLQDSKIALYVGRIHLFKGPQILVKSVRYILRYIKDFHVIIAGPDDGFEKQLKTVIETENVCDHVTLLGFVSEGKKIQLYDGANVVVIPSLFDWVEAYSNVASEAWFRNKKVVASKVGALKYRVRENDKGYLLCP